MKKCLFIAYAAMAVATAAFHGCGDSVAGKDCKVSCQDVDNTCVQKCTDDTCRTACSTDLDNCTASCSSVVVTSDGGK